MRKKNGRASFVPRAYGLIQKKKNRGLEKGEAPRRGGTHTHESLSLARNHPHFILYTYTESSSGGEGAHALGPFYSFDYILSWAPAAPAVSIRAWTRPVSRLDLRVYSQTCIYSRASRHIGDDANGQNRVIRGEKERERRE